MKKLNINVLIIIILSLFIQGQIFAQEKNNKPKYSIKKVNNSVYFFTEFWKGGDNGVVIGNIEVNTINLK